MKKEVPPWAIYVAGGAVVLIFVVIYFAMNRGPAKINATEQYSKAVLADPDPPHHRRD